MAASEAQNPESDDVASGAYSSIKYDSKGKVVKPAPSCWTGPWKPCNDFKCDARNASYPIFVKTTLTREYVDAFDAVARANDLRYRFIVDVHPSTIVRQIHEVKDDADVDLSKPSEWIGFGGKCYEHDFFRLCLRRDGEDAWPDHFVHFTFTIVDDACLAAGSAETADEHRTSPAPIEGYSDIEGAHVRVDACSKPRGSDETGFQIIVVTNAPDSTDDLDRGPWKSTIKVFRAPLRQIENIGLVERVTQTPTMWYEDASWALSIVPPLELVAPRPAQMRQYAWNRLKEMADAEKADANEKQEDKLEADSLIPKD